jgi:hypothetical protein
MKPAVIALAVRPVPRLMGLPGVVVSVFVPFPSSPVPFDPQHLTVLSSRMTHVWLWSAVIALAVRPVPRLMGLPGVVVEVFVPLPS